jgi:glycine hydroxymethyltransferase
VRIGTCALTSRGYKEQDFERVADLLHKCVVLATDVQSKSGKALKAFKAGVHAHEGIKSLKEEVETFARSFPMPGFDTAGL